MKVYRFTVYFEGDPEDLQYRYVVAPNEEKAYDKMWAYRDSLIKRGFDRMRFPKNPIVEIDYVII